MFNFMLKKPKFLLSILFKMNSALVMEVGEHHQGTRPSRSAGESPVIRGRCVTRERSQPTPAVLLGKQP